MSFLLWFFGRLDLLLGVRFALVVWLLKTSCSWNDKEHVDVFYQTYGLVMMSQPLPSKRNKKLNTKWQEKVVIHQQNAILYSNAICIESAKHTVLTFPILWSRKIHSMWTQWKCVTDQSVSYPNLTHTVKIQKERTVLPKPNRRG